MPIIGGTISRVVIVDDGMYHGKGIVIRWVQRVTNSFARSARRAAPVRSGQLRNGIRQGTPRNPGRKVVQGTISSHAPHTMYVLRGTHGPIMSNKLWAVGGPDSPAAWQMIRVEGKGPGAKPHYRRAAAPGMTMAVGRNLYPPERRMFIVSGQRANNFMAEAWAETAARHPALRGVPFPIRL